MTEPNIAFVPSIHEGGAGASVAGVDGCRNGWVVVLRDTLVGTSRARVVPQFRSVLTLPETPSVIAVDVPIGLPSTASAGGRDGDVIARKLLGKRASSVFSAPTRAALAAFRAGRGYRAVSTANRGGIRTAPGLSRQAFNILPKIAEVDAAVDPAMQSLVREVHPELCFAQAQDGTPMSHPKRRPTAGVSACGCLKALGSRRRLAFLARNYPKTPRATICLTPASPAGPQSAWLMALRL